MLVCSFKNNNIFHYYPLARRRRRDDVIVEKILTRVGGVRQRDANGCEKDVFATRFEEEKKKEKRKKAHRYWMKKNSIAISVSSRFLIHVVSPTVAPPLSRCLRGKWEQRIVVVPDYPSKRREP